MNQVCDSHMEENVKVCADLEKDPGVAGKSPSQVYQAIQEHPGDSPYQ